MSFWQKFKMGLVKSMQGRRGQDQLSRALTWTGLILVIVALFLLPPVGTILSTLGLVFYGVAVFRMFSRNLEKRYRENYAYTQFADKIKRKVKQFFTRLKNSKKYKYFHCPDCKSLLRLPRGVGEVTITCGKCGKAFKKKA